MKLPPIIAGRTSLDPIVTGTALTLMGIGAIMVGSASVSIATEDFGDPFHYLRDHVVALGIGTAALVVAHLFGLPARLAPLLELGVPVIEDCAQSLGATEEGEACGRRGALAIASFYATKVITTGQGGLVAGSDPDQMAVVRDRVDYDGRDDWAPRFNYRMGELPAAL